MNELSKIKNAWNKVYVTHGKDVPWSNKDNVDSSLPVIIDFLKKNHISTSSLLDYGAGSGHFAVALKEKLSIPRVVCADITDGGADREFLKQKGIEFVQVFQPKDVKEKFDIILCWSVLNHLDKNLREKFFAQFADMLMGGGAY